ncbi:uncharacterized protein METZ01_LOCUS147230, partial [marine metagenome]
MQDAGFRHIIGCRNTILFEWILPQNWIEVGTRHTLTNADGSENTFTSNLIVSFLKWICCPIRM